MINKRKKKFILYFHRNKKTKSIFYVGIGIQGREYQRIKRSKRWNDYVNKYGFYYEVIGENLTWKTACQAEKDWINFLGRADYYKGELINMTDGGDGTGGYHGYWLDKKRPPATIEYRLKMSEVIKNSEAWKKNHHKKHTSEVIELLREKARNQINKSWCFRKSRKNKRRETQREINRKLIHDTKWK